MCQGEVDATNLVMGEQEGAGAFSDAAASPTAVRAVTLLQKQLSNPSCCASLSRCFAASWKS